MKCIRLCANIVFITIVKTYVHADYTHSSNLEVNIISVDLATGIFTANGHGLVNGDYIRPVLKPCASGFARDFFARQGDRIAEKYPQTPPQLGFRTGLLYSDMLFNSEKFLLTNLYAIL